MLKQKLVVVGNGMAGARAVEEVLARGGADMFDITMFGAEPYGNYNRILLSNILCGIQDASEIYINPLDWYEENGITLHAGSPVVDIDRNSKKVKTASGIVAPYDVLLIATGSRAFIPPIQGLNKPDGTMKDGIFGFRTIDDCDGIIATAKTSRRAAVIGGGLLGLEAARGLLNHGCEVHLIHLGGHLMPAQLDKPAGAMLRKAMEKMGVNIHLERNTAEILGEDRITGLHFKTGETLECDMVVVAAGIRPNVEIGRTAGLTVERAIVVDNNMCSVDDKNVYVVGECAQHRGQVYGLVAPLWDQAKVFADHVTHTDRDAAYHGSKLATKLKVMGVEVASMGLTEPEHEHDEVLQFSEARHGTYKKLIVRDGRLVGGILMGDISKAAYLMQAFDRESPLPEERLSLLFDLGTPPQKVTLDEMPATAQVCNCNGVTKAAIGACVAAGKRTPKAVMQATRAGMGCGSCKGLVAEVVSWFCGGDMEEDPSVHYYVPCIPLAKPELVKAVRELELKSVSALFKALAIDGREDAASKPALASLLATLWNDEYEDERDARFINDRVHGNIQKDGTFSVVPEMAGGVTTPGRPHAHRAGGCEIRRASGETHRRPAHRSGGYREAGHAGGVGRSRHARRLCLGEKLSHLQELHRHRLLPVRARRQHGAGAENRVQIPRPRQPRQTQAGHSRLPTQLLRSDGEGCRCRGDWRRPLGDLCRRRRRLAYSQRRCVVHGDRRGRGDAALGTFHPMVPGKMRNTRSARIVSSNVWASTGCVPWWSMIRRASPPNSRRRSMPRVRRR